MRASSELEACHRHHHVWSANPGPIADRQLLRVSKQKADDKPPPSLRFSPEPQLLQKTTVATPDMNDFQIIFDMIAVDIA